MDAYDELLSTGSCKSAEEDAFLVDSLYLALALARVHSTGTLVVDAANDL
jgi:hypothetical protein